MQEGRFFNRRFKTDEIPHITHNLNERFTDRCWRPLTRSENYGLREAKFLG